MSLTVEHGEVFAVLGPNGAGKTTTAEAVAGLRTPDAGTVRVLGHDPLADHAAVRDVLGVQPQESSFRDEFTAQPTTARAVVPGGHAAPVHRRCTGPLVSLWYPG